MPCLKVLAFFFLKRKIKQLKGHLPPGIAQLHAPEAPMWTPREEEVVEAPGVRAVCFRPTTFRRKQCKAVKYCGKIIAEHCTSCYGSGPGGIEDGSSIRLT